MPVESTGIRLDCAISNNKESSTIRNGSEDHRRHGKIKKEAVGRHNENSSNKPMNPRQPSEQDDHKYGNDCRKNIEHQNSGSTFGVLDFQPDSI